MPGRDRTGPMSEGPMTGDGFGACSPYDMQCSARAFPRRGFGRRPGHGRGRDWSRGMRRSFGWRHMARATGLPGWRRYGYAPAWRLPAGYEPYEPSAEEELAALRNRAQRLHRKLQAVSQRIGELEANE